MPANWDPIQNLSNGRVEWPTGPITGIDQGSDRPVRIEAWVVQGGDPDDDETEVYEGPSQACSQSSWFGWVPNRWTAAEPGWVNGTFQPGPAVGIALLALHNKSTNTYEYEWWHDVITLMP